MRKSLQTKVGSPLTRMIIAHNLKNCYARLTPSKKKIIDLFDSSSQLQIPSCNIACKTNEVLSRCKKSICYWNTFLLWILPDVLLYYHVFFGQYIRREKKGCTTTIWTFLFLFDSFPSCSYQSLVVTTTLYRSLLKRKETQPTTKVCFPKRQFFSWNQCCYRAKEQISTSF